MRTQNSGNPVSPFPFYDCCARDLAPDVANQAVATWARAHPPKHDGRQRRLIDPLDMPTLRSTRNALGVLAGGGEADLVDDAAEVILDRAARFWGFPTEGMPCLLFLVSRDFLLGGEVLSKRRRKKVLLTRLISRCECFLALGPVACSQAVISLQGIYHLSPIVPPTGVFRHSKVEFLFKVGEILPLGDW